MANYYEYIDSTGIITVDTSQLLADVQGEYRAVFGDNLALEPATPQGRLIELEAAARSFTLNLCATLQNQFNVNFATGQSLDGLGQLFQIKRQQATYTQTYAFMYGVPMTIIPIGTQVQTDDGDIFSTVSEVTIQPSGQVQALFQADIAGEVQCPLNTLTNILTSINGLERVNNPTPIIILGADIESDYDYKKRILQSQYSGTGHVQDIYSGLLALPGVRAANIFNNGTGEEVNGVPGHTIAVTIIPTTTPLADDIADQIADTIYRKKSAGCGTFGSITRQVKDESSNVFYDVNFSSAVTKPLQATVSIDKGTFNGTEAELTALVLSAFERWQANASPEYPAPQIGQPVYNVTVAKSISSFLDGTGAIIRIVVLSDGTTTYYDIVPIAEGEYGSFAQSDITVEYL